MARLETEMSAEYLPKKNGDEAFLQRLQSEVDAWRRERIVSSRQADSILGRYGLRYEVAERGRRINRMTAIFATFGAILLGVGIILLVAANRQEFDLPRGAKIALMMGAVLFLYALGYFLRYETRFKTVGGAVIFLGAVMYGAAIFLAGIVYNIKANDPSLPLYWFLGVVPLVYVTRSSPILSLSLITLGVWLGSRVIFSMKDTHFEELIAIRTIALFLMLGVLSYFLAPIHQWFRPTREMWRPFQIAGLLAVFAALFLLGFRFLFEDVAFWSIPDPPTSLLVTYALIASLTVAAMWAAVYLWAGAVRTLPLEAAAGLVLLGLAFVAAYVPFDDEDTYVLLFNTLLLVATVGAIPVGLARREEGYVNAAVGFFALMVITRYFDLTWNLSGRSLFFIGAGAVVLVGAFLLEHYRRRVLRRLREV